MLSLKNVSLELKSGETLLNNISLEVKKGDFITISGCEKNREALLSVLGCLEPKYKGEVYVDDIEISNFSEVQNLSLRREKFAYFLRSSVILDSLTVRENVELPLSFTGLDIKKQEEDVTRAISIVGMSDFINVKAAHLTDWQKNKLGIAILLAKNPEIMVISEPLRVLDLSKVNEIVGLLTALNKEGITLILATGLDVIKTVGKRQIEVSEEGVIVELKKQRQSKKTVEEKPKAKRTRKPKNLQPKQEEESVSSVEDFVPEEDVKPVKSRKSRKTTAR